MSLADQFRALQTGAAAMRKAIFGFDSAGAAVQIDYNRGEYTCAGYYTPIKHEHKTEEAGYMDELDGIVRIAKASVSWTPELDKQIRITEATGVEITLIIKSLAGAHAASVEWVLGCKALN